MAPQPTIPHEIIAQLEGGACLLIRGGPGSGKTLLTLSLLLHMKNVGRRVTYISSRLPVATILNTMPLSTSLGEEALVDASVHRETGQPSGVARMPLSDLSDLAMIYLKTTGEDSVVALDSWDALLQREKRKELEVYTAAIDLINRTNGALIFTMEDVESPNPLQHLADVEVILTSQTCEGNTIRRMHVKKLRGAPIETPVYLFSLNGGVFKAFDPKVWSLKDYPINAKNPPQPIPEKEGFFSTGMTALDKTLGGGYKRGSYVGIEVDLEVPNEVSDLTFLPAAADFISKGRPVEALPPGARDRESIWDTAKAIFAPSTWETVRKEFLKGAVKVFSYGSRSEEDLSRGIGTSIQKDIEIWNETRDELRRKFNQPVLQIVGYDTLWRMYGRNQIEPVVGSALAQTRRNGDLVISIVTSDIDVKNSILGISDYYFRLTLCDGLPVFWGIKPRTPLFTLCLFNDKGTPKTNLVRVS